MTAEQFIINLMVNEGAMMYSDNNFITVKGSVKINAQRLGLPRLNLKNIIFENTVEILNFVKKEVLIFNSKFLNGIILKNIISSTLLLIFAETSNMLCKSVFDCRVITTNLAQIAIFISKGIVAELCGIPTYTYENKPESDSSGEMFFQA